jgi:hypothetical protein
VEDTGIFPSTKQQHPELAAVIDGLFADHHKMDPMLEEGDRTFAGLPATVEAASGLVSRLSALLDTHLATEETHIIPTLRAAKAFPAAHERRELEMYAQGFAWSSHGIAPTSSDKLYGLRARDGGREAAGRARRVRARCEECGERPRPAPRARRSPTGSICAPLPSKRGEVGAAGRPGEGSGPG